MNRRSFLMYASAAAPTIFLSKKIDKVVFPTKKIVFLGSDTWNSGFRLKYDHAENSTYSELDVETGDIYQLIVPINNGHDIQPISDSIIALCPYLGDRTAILNRNKKKVIEYITAPKGFLFSGHSCSFKGNIFFSLKSQEYSYANQIQGKILVVSKESFKKVDEFNSQGLWPHDISIFSDKIAITHTGTNGPLINPKKYLYDSSKSCVNLFSIDTKRLLKKIDTKGFSPSHISFSPTSEKLFFNSVQWINPSLENITSFQKIENFQFSLSEKINRRISSPEPLFAVDARGFVIQKIILPIEISRRAVELIVDDSRDCFYATFSHSDVIIKVNFNGKILSVKKAFDIGLAEVRGLAFLGDKYLIASGKYRGVAILDRSSLEPIMRYDIMTYGNTHIKII